MSIYYLSIGTNIEPEKNAVNIVRELCKRFGTLFVYPFVYTKPEDMETDLPFLNSLAAFKSDEDNQQVKNTLNQIEISLGRDRADPLSSQKDRVADIDIITQSEVFDIDKFEVATERYVQSVLHPVHKPANAQLPFDRPSSVNLDGTTGDIIVVDNELNSF